MTRITKATADNAEPIRGVTNRLGLTVDDLQFFLKDKHPGTQITVLSGLLRIATDIEIDANGNINIT